MRGNRWDPGSSGGLSRAWVFLFAALAIGVPHNAEAVQQSSPGYDFLIGSWEGELEYLDYGDNTTLVRLPTHLDCRRDGQGLVLEYSFTEPDGRVVKSRERLYETSSGGLYFDGLWRIEDRSDDRTAGNYRLVLSQDGEDNGQLADIQNTVAVDGDILTITKSVLYEGSAEWLQRNQFRFVRVPLGALTLSEEIDIFDPLSGAFQGTEQTWFGPDGRRLRQEITDSDGTPTLLFFLLHDAEGRESEAIYFEDGSTKPSREFFTYSDSGRRRTTIYYYEPGVAADRTEIDLDAAMREVRKRYYRADGSQYGAEEVLWDFGGNKLGWNFSYVDREGGASFRYSYEEFADDGEWVRRTRSRNGAPERLEVRSRITGAVSSQSPHPVPFASGQISTERAEASPSFSRDGRTMVFARYDGEWSVKEPYVAYLEPAGWRTEPLSSIGPVYNLSISPDANTVFYATRAGDRLELFRIRRVNGGWSTPQSLSDDYGISGSYPNQTESGDLLFFDTDGESGAGIYVSRRDGDGFTPAVSVYTPSAGDAFDAYTYNTPNTLLVTRCFDEACRSGALNGIWEVRLDDSGVWHEEKLAGLPYAWGAQVVESLGLLVFTDGEDILAVPQRAAAVSHLRRVSDERAFP